MLHREKQIAWVNLLKNLYESYMVHGISIPLCRSYNQQIYAVLLNNHPNSNHPPLTPLFGRPCSGFYKEMGSGFGFLGEQGGESVHAVFNSLQRAYNNIPMVLTNFSTWSRSITSVSALRTFRKLPPHPKESRLSRTPVSSFVFFNFPPDNSRFAHLYYVALVVYTKHAKCNPQKIRFRMISAQL